MAAKVSRTRLVGEPPSGQTHDNMVAILHECEHNNGQRLELRELCDCGELFDVVAMEGAMLHGEMLHLALGWFAQLARACAYGHTHSLCHGQVRPEHALLASVRRLRSTFPKAAGGVDGWAPPPQHRDMAAKLLGFRSYALDSEGRAPLCRPWRHLDAPEMQGREAATPDELAAADSWSLGVLLVFMLTGLPPSLKPPHLPPAASESLRQLVDALLQREPAHRKPAAWAQRQAERLLQAAGGTSTAGTDATGAADAADAADAGASSESGAGGSSGDAMSSSSRSQSCENLSTSACDSGSPDSGSPSSTSPRDSSPTTTRKATPAFGQQTGM